jgi:hypothetical protein
MKTVLFLLMLPAVAAAQIPNHAADLAALRAQYPASMNGDQTGELMGRLAFKLRGEGFGLLRKDAGNNCAVKGLPVRVSCDWILYQPTRKGCDILGDAGGSDGLGTSKPAWCGGNGEDIDFSRFVQVTVDPGGPADPGGGGGGGGTPDTVTKAEMEKAIAIAIVNAHSQIWSEMEQLVGTIDARIDALPKDNAVTDDHIRELIAAAFARAVVEGKTRVSFGHQHFVQLGITLPK